MKNIVSFFIGFLFLLCATLCFGGDKAFHDAYFDKFTGYKYIKIDNNTYAEYSTKGKFLKNVPADLPLLKNSTIIYPITENSYILYEKLSYGSFNQKFLEGNKAHPKGWEAKKLLIALN